MISKICLIVVILFTSLMHAQVPAELPSIEQDTVYSLKDVDVKPEYPRGMKALAHDVLKKFKLPKVDQDLDARVIVEFIIEKEGRVTNARIIKDPGYGLAPEALKAISLLKKRWRPALKGNTAVRCFYIFPITVRIMK